MNLRRFSVVMLSACAVSRGQSVDSADLCNNLTQPVSVDGNFSVVNLPALSFRTTAVDFILDPMTIPLRNRNLMRSGTLTHGLDDNSGPSGATVGPDLGFVSIAGISSASNQNVTFTGLNRVLLSNTNDDAAIHATGIAKDYCVGGTFSAGGTITGSHGCSVSNDSGISRAAPDRSVIVFGRVTAVPEPSASIHSEIGVLARALAARQSSKKPPLED